MTRKTLNLNKWEEEPLKLKNLEEKTTVFDFLIKCQKKAVRIRKMEKKSLDLKKLSEKTVRIEKIARRPFIIEKMDPKNIKIKKLKGRKPSDLKILGKSHYNSKTDRKKIWK